MVTWEYGRSPGGYVVITSSAGHRFIVLMGKESTPLIEGHVRAMTAALAAAFPEEPDAHQASSQQRRQATDSHGAHAGLGEGPVPPSGDSQ